MTLKSTKSAITSMDVLSAAPGYPPEEAFSKGAIAVIECIEEIPCNPCEAACRFGAIRVGDQLTALPQLLAEKCSGCGSCIAACPGLAIFLVDKTYSESEALLGLPYEFLPVPDVGATVAALDRQGQRICKATVIRVDNRPRNNYCRVVSITVPKQYADIVRGIKCKAEKEIADEK